MDDLGAIEEILLHANNGSDAFQSTVAALASAAAAAAAHDSNHNAGPQQPITATQKAALIDQLQRSLNASVAAAASASAASSPSASSSADVHHLLGNSQQHITAADDAAAGSSVQLPRNLTLIFNELQRFSFRSEDSLQPYKTRGMTDEEYSRFVSDMWIGIVLSMLVVFIVLALCLWFLFHKFQQWKRQYNEVHNAHTLTHVLHTSPVGLDTGFSDEALPNYTLVSGLPTYDDALEQIRHTNSTNHLLINHQTLMKLFGSAPAAMGNSKDNNFTITSTSSGAGGISPVHATVTSNNFCPNCSTEEFANNGGGGGTVNKQQQQQPASSSSALGATDRPPRMYLARIESCQLQQLSPAADAESRRSSLANISAASASNGNLTSSSSNGTTTIITTGSGHRFVCTTVQAPPRLLAPQSRRGSASGGLGAGLDRRRSSEATTPAGGFRRLLSLNPDAVAALQYENAAAAAAAAAAHASGSGGTSPGSAAGAPEILRRPNTLRLLGRRLADVPSNSTGCLNMPLRQRDRNYNTVQMAVSPTTGAAMPASQRRRQRWYSTNEMVDDGENNNGMDPNANPWRTNRWSMMGFSDVPMVSFSDDDTPMHRQTGGSAGNLSAEALYRHRGSLC